MNLQNKMYGKDYIPEEVLEIIFKERWLQIWVPKDYSGLGLSFSEGLEVLKNLAFCDGSLGWIVTLCSGANYFSRNLKPKVAKALFENEKTCFGGSGMIGGTAEKIGNRYRIQGTWRFATGAPYLSHFTLNATLTENGNPITDDEGNLVIRSFILSKDQVKIIRDWKSMGMKATGTFSFEVKEAWVDEDYSFVYNEFFTNSVLNRIPFRIFADLTLLVNYIGIAQHFIDLAQDIRPHLSLEKLKKYIDKNEAQADYFANQLEQLLEQGEENFSELQAEIHEFGETFVSDLSHQILDVYFQLGIRASNTHEPIHQVFCDYFTATQHANFRKKDIEMTRCAF